MTSEQGARLPGYRKKPGVIVGMAIGFLLIPVVMLIQVWVRSGGSWRVLGAVIGSGYFLQEWGLAWSAAAAVSIVSRWSFAYFIILSGYVLTTKVAVLVRTPHLETPAGLIILCFWFGAAIYCSASSLKAPYLNPKLRWWTRPPRIAMCRDAAILYQGTQIPVTVLNLSQGGVFVRVGETVAEQQVIPQRLGEAFQIAMALMRADHPESAPEPFESSAQLVWKGAPETPYRNGMGIKFISLGRAKRRQLKRVLRDEARRNNAAVV